MTQAKKLYGIKEEKGIYDAPELVEKDIGITTESIQKLLEEADFQYIYIQKDNTHYVFYRSWDEAELHILKAAEQIGEGYLRRFKKDFGRE